MTEEEWRNAAEPAPLLKFLQTRRLHTRKTVRRKLRLFACACCRRVWDFLGEVARGWVCEAEGLTDRGQALTSEEWKERRSIRGWGDDRLGSGDAEFASQQTLNSNVMDAASEASRNAANARRFSSATTDWDRVLAAERRVQALVLRDVIGNPFAAGAPRSGWLTSTVLSVAHAAYDERQLPGGELDSDRLAVLADALEEVGAPAELATHLRSPGPHVRGCFVVDLCLGLN